MGVRGIPAAHGGFETFAERLAPYLVANGWDVSVYCQEVRSSSNASSGKEIWKSVWEGVTRIHITVKADTAVNSIRFDSMCISHVIGESPDVVLILGYNTAIFALRLRMAGIRTVFNMDGIEWSRAKWSPMAKAWLYINERAGCLLGHHLIADHPHIEKHLRTRARAKKITVIPYGTDLLDTATDSLVLEQLGLRPMQYVTVIARAEPDNSILSMVRAFSAKSRNIKMVVLGKYLPETVGYHAQVRAAASDEVIFPGAIYTKQVVQALRRNSLFYLHGHQAGGCNPSLVEAMGAGNPVIAHDNRFNRWVVGKGAVYFKDEASCQGALEQLIDNADQLQRYAELNRRRAAALFDWAAVLASYDELLHYFAVKQTKRDPEASVGRRDLWQIYPDVF
jgi:glycosyltransferase involved in cell wall biosynthesis